MCDQNAKEKKSVCNPLSPKMILVLAFLFEAAYAQTA